MIKYNKTKQVRNTLEVGDTVWHPYTLDEVLEDTDLNEPLPEEVPCKTHPDAPHGFNRNASHAEGRYVCDCEHWEPEPIIMDETKECCEGGPMTAGCYHDHCKGPSGVRKRIKDEVEETRQDLEDIKNEH